MVDVNSKIISPKLEDWRAALGMPELTDEEIEAVIDEYEAKLKKGQGLTDNEKMFLLSYILSTVFTEDGIHITDIYQDDEFIEALAGIIRDALPNERLINLITEIVRDSETIAEMAYKFVKSLSDAEFILIAFILLELIMIKGDVLEELEKKFGNEERNK